MVSYLAHVQGPNADYVDDFDSWDDVLFDFPEIDHESYPGFPIEFTDGDATITVSEVEE